MARDIRQIKIESILGGHAPTTHFSSADQFRASLGIDPAKPSTDSPTARSDNFSGLLRPVSIVEDTTSLAGAPLWILENPKNNKYYVYDAVGSVYTLNEDGQTTTGLGDLNDGGGATGNGAAYYDNYIYFARNTTIARYGPLNGTPAFTDDYWSGSLGLTSLTNTLYPLIGNGSVATTSNHILHRHSNGRLYVADVVDNQGTLHYVQTTKTTVEGDTNNGSTYDALNVGYNLWITAIESYGEFLVLGLYEGANAVVDSKVRTRAKVAFWDTTSDSVNSIVWSEYPDSFITSIKNLNGTLYFTSVNEDVDGFRMLRYVGGSSFEEITQFPLGASPYPGGVDAESQYIVFGSDTTSPENSGCVYSWGLKGVVNRGIFNIASIGGSARSVTAVKLINGNSSAFLNRGMIIGFTGSGENGIAIAQGGTDYSNAPCSWWSQMYRIGQPFKITKIRIPLAQPLTAGMTVTPKIYFDSGVGTDTLTTINSTNYGTNTQTIVIRPENLTADNDFWLELRWTGSALCVVSLPITIEYELLDVESAFP